MTSILKSVRNSGDFSVGIRAVVAGQEKMGKTTFLASAPKPLLVPLEEGTAGVFVDKTDKIESYNNLIGLMDEIIQARGAGYKSICFDGSVGIERLIHNHIVTHCPESKGNKMASMETAHGGYGKAYAVALNLFEDFLSKCDILARNGINIVIASHVFASKQIDPTAGEFDTWDLLLHSPKNNKTFGKREFITQWADVIGFLYSPMMISKNGEVAMGISKNVGRVMGLSRTPNYVAGNRFGVTGEIQIGMAHPWNDLALAIANATQGRINQIVTI